MKKNKNLQKNNVKSLKNKPSLTVPNKYKKETGIICKICNKFRKENRNIAVLTLSGVIGQVGKFEKGLNIDNVNPLLEKAFETKKLRAVVINVNSPGGSPVQSELIHNRIKELSQEKKIPVFTFAQDVAASGGYFILCAGDEMYSHTSSIVGSIGVISAGFGFEELIKKIGVSRRVYAQGKNKSVLDPFKKEDKDSIKILNQAQEDVHESFKEIVRNARANKLKKDEDELFNGAFWSGKGAQEVGLIDGIGDMRSILKKKYSNKIKFIDIKPKKKGMLKELLASSLISATISKIEEKNIYNKFGL